MDSEAGLLLFSSGCVAPRLLLVVLMLSSLALQRPHWSRWALPASHDSDANRVTVQVTSMRHCHRQGAPWNWPHRRIIGGGRPSGLAAPRSQIIEGQTSAELARPKHPHPHRRCTLKIEIAADIATRHKILHAKDSEPRLGFSGTVRGSKDAYGLQYHLASE